MATGTLLKDTLPKDPELRQNASVAAGLLVFSFFLLLFVGTDGWFRADILRSDSAWFMTAGRSWMLGLVPYVDFADSKGPLLWLIYGLGYLISPSNFHGVFIFETLFYWINFYVLYKIAKVFLHDAGRSVTVSVLMALLYFYPGNHNEMRVEDFCHLFQSVMLYVLVKVWWCDSRKAKYFLWLGVCLGATLMMKYSYTLTLGIPSLILLIYLVKRREPVWKYVGWVIGGFCVMVLPFVVYLICVGAFEAFIHEYFFSTGETILNLWNDSQSDGSTSLRSKWPFVIWSELRHYNFQGEYLRFVFLGMMMSLWMFRKNKWLMSTCFLWYVASVLLYSVNGGGRYYFVNAVFAVGGVIWLVSLIKELTPGFSAWIAGCVIAFLAITVTFYPNAGLYHSERNIRAERIRGHVADYINSVEFQTGRYPTLIYYHTLDRGEHVGTHAVAGTKYWAPQYGITETMSQEYEDDIIIQKPDLIIVHARDTIHFKHLEEIGYDRVMEYDIWPERNEPDWKYALYENSAIRSAPSVP